MSNTNMSVVIEKDEFIQERKRRLERLVREELEKRNRIFWAFHKKSKICLEKALRDLEKNDLSLNDLVSIEKQLLNFNKMDFKDIVNFSIRNYYINAITVDSLDDAFSNQELIEIIRNEKSFVFVFINKKHNSIETKITVSKVYIDPIKISERPFIKVTPWGIEISVSDFTSKYELNRNHTVSEKIIWKKG